MDYMQDGFIDVQIICPECGRAFFNRGKINESIRQIPLHDDCIGAGRNVFVDKLTDKEAIQEGKEFYVKLIKL